MVMKKLLLTTAILIGLTSVTNAGIFKDDVESILKDLDKTSTKCYNTIMNKDEHDNYTFKGTDIFDSCEPLYDSFSKMWLYFLDTDNAEELAGCTQGFLSQEWSTCSIMSSQVSVKILSYVSIMQVELKDYTIADWDMTGWNDDYTKRLELLLDTPLMKIIDQNKDLLSAGAVSWN
jgi:hypothetical protein